MKALLLIPAFFLFTLTACNAPTPQPPPPPPPVGPSPTNGSPPEITATLNPTSDPTPQVSTATIEPSPATGTITGHTLFSNNFPVSGMLVKLVDLPSISATTDSDGAYTLAGVPSGDHLVTASSSGLGSGQFDVFVTANQTSVQDLIVFIFFELPSPTPATGETANEANWADTWVLNFGTMKLEQSGGKVSGVYHNAFNNVNGTIHGVISGGKVDGTWSNGSKSGSIHWLLGSNGNAFTGNFNGSSTWCGARSGKPFPVGCSFAGTWTNLVAGNEKCPMKLTRTDLTVKGSYCNGSVSGNISYTGKSEDTILTGTWTTKGSGPFKLYLLGYNALQFQGAWNQKNSWCGWRANQKVPSPCLR